MSIPVRYSAANYADVVESGLSNTLLQEEQYHLQQQLFCNNNSSCPNYSNCRVSNSTDLEQQQQLKQQRLLMSSSVSLSLAQPAIAKNSVNTIMNQQQEHQDTLMSNPLSLDEDMMEATTSTMAVGKTAHGNDDNAARQTEWMSEEGRCGTPGAAGFEYQNYGSHQQETPANMDQSMKPSLMDNENNNTNMKNLENELNALSTDELYATLKEYNVLQDKYHTVLLMPRESRREVTAGGRDGSAYVLRCLKMWYELPSDVLFSAMSLVDRFLDRMAVKPKHMACMSVASFHLAIRQLGLKPIPAEDLVTISQCGCTAGDLERMSNVIENKLGVQMGQSPITSVTFMRIFYAAFRNLAKEIDGTFFEFYKQFIKLEDLENRLEILLCDVKTTVITPSTLALVLVSLHLDFHIKASYTRGRPELKVVFDYILYLQQFMRIPSRVFTCGFSIVSGILSHYNGQNKQPYKQRLVWKLSSRTLRVLRPTNRFSSDLPTIEEVISSAMDDGCRSRTESLSSEEEEDWPTSPIIPIFEQC